MVAAHHGDWASTGLCLIQTVAVLRKVLGSLETKLYATIRAFNTVKQARDAMPEFAKYLPEDADPKCKTLPAITDLVTDLMKAGWPDGGKKNDKAKAKAA
jgi:hypothetical protein